MPQLPFSKSLSNRALVIRFLSGKKFSISSLSDSSDTNTLSRLLEDLPNDVDVGEAGTSWRFLAAALAITPGKWTLRGSDRLMQRPILGLLNALQSLGAEIGFSGPGETGPIHIEGKKIRGGTVTVDATTSSQFVSALLMIAPILEEGMNLQLEGNAASLPYIHMTLGLMKHFGVQHRQEGNTIFVPPQEYQPCDYAVEPDWSSASYWLEVAALAPRAEIVLKGLSPQSLQGDSAIMRWMEPFGVTCRTTPEGIVVTSKKKEIARKVEVNCLHHPDLAPALVATAAGLEGNATITGLQNLNAKESRRQDVLFSELSSAGVRISSSPGKLVLNGGKIRPRAKFNVHNDHRMAMSFAPLCFVNGPVEIDDPGVVEKSYPGFWEELGKAGFGVVVNG